MTTDGNESTSYGVILLLANKNLIISIYACLRSYYSTSKLIGRYLRNSMYERSI